MPMGFTVWAVLLGLIALVWFLRHLEISRVQRTERVLSSDSYPGTVSPAPRVSVLVAAKDEEDNIAACVRSFLAQDYPDFELIVIDDRSTDRTGIILADLARQHPDRLRVVTITQLRPGWFGKNNAMRAGGEAATGTWLCFADADCVQTSTRTLSVAMRECQEHGIDFLSILPVLITRSFWERIIQPVCAGVMMLWYRPERVNDPRTRVAYANGAFMLLRREVYDALGGHEPVKTEVNEDMHLARLAKQRGFRLKVLRNADLYTTHMYASLRATWRGWSRIFYGCLGSLRRLVIALIVLLTFSLFPWISLITALVWRLAGGGGESAGGVTLVLALAALAVLLEQTVIARFYRLSRMPMVYSLAYSVGGVLACGMLLNAMLKLGGTTTVTWRGTTYRADQLEPTDPERSVSG